MKLEEAEALATVAAGFLFFSTFPPFMTHLCLHLRLLLQFGVVILRLFMPFVRTSDTSNFTSIQARLWMR
jgi:hypothetical protein